MAITTRFFILKSEHVHEHSIDLMPDDGDFMPLTDLKTFGIVGKFTHENQEYTVVKAVLPPYVVQTIQDSIDENINALSLDSLDALGITGIYGGREYSWEPYTGLYWIIQARFGLDLSGEYDTGQFDEDGQPIMAKYLRPVMIAGE